MRIAVAQIAPIIGDFEGNFLKIQESYERACAEQARLLLTPELGVCGYPPHDLIERPEIFERCEASLARLASLTQGRSCALVVGGVGRNPQGAGKSAQNIAVVLQGGKEVFRQAKTLLPTYDVFDEARYFEPATEVRLWECDGKRVALAICEDLWARDTRSGRSLYVRNPVHDYGRLQADLILSLSSSPYEWGKRARREQIHADVAQEVRVPVVYVNQVGATDEILFDGGSFAVDPQGRSVGRLPEFESGFSLFDSETLEWRVPGPSPAGGQSSQPLSELALLHRALVAGIREYFQRSGFRIGVIGLSGGIDSAVVAALAVEALGAQNVFGVAMPSQYSSAHSLEDAQLLAAALGIPFEVRPIKFSFSTLNRELGEARGGLAPLAQENLQSRLRGVTLMTLANHYGALVLTTGNKSELATGYCTLYGDMCGAIAPIGDLFKTRVYELAEEINRAWLQARGREAIPRRSISKAPSAELRPDQKDQDSLPPYPVLDGLLAGYLEAGLPVEALEAAWAQHPQAVSAGLGSDWVRKILRLVEINEYKRRQAAPVLKISPKAFGMGRRIPIAKKWEQS